MTDTLTVLNAMKEYYSPDGDTQELLPMCEAACRELAPRVRSDADLGDIRLINAAAAFAYRRFCIKRLFDDGGVTSFKAGDVAVNVSRRELADYAAEEKTAALAAAAPLLRDDEFHFGQVKV